MQKLEIKGGKKISGTIIVSGSKNATLPILASTILTNKKVIIKNIPIVNDVETMAALLSTIGSTIKFNKREKTIEVFNKQKLKTFAPYHLLRTMRAGVLVLGPLLAKYRVAKVSLPGGCAIGSRPINIHLDALKKMGAKIRIKDGYIIASAKKGLKGCTIKFPKISVGATENVLIAACFAKGETKLRNCALEPEIIDLINFHFKIDKIQKPTLLNQSSVGNSYDSSVLEIILKNKAVVSIFSTYNSPYATRYFFLFENGIIEQIDNNLIVRGPTMNLDSKGFFKKPNVIKSFNVNDNNDYNFSLKESINFFLNTAKKKKSFNKNIFECSIKSNSLIL